MSDYEAYKGKLTSTGKTLEEFAEEVGLEQDCWSDTLEEAFLDKYEGKYILLGIIVYKVDRVSFDPTDCAEATLNSDGTIDFTVAYYNGGCGFEEAIEEALKRFEQQEGR